MSRHRVNVRNKEVEAIRKLHFDGIIANAKKAIYLKGRSSALLEDIHFLSCDFTAQVDEGAMTVSHTKRLTLHNTSFSLGE